MATYWNDTAAFWDDASPSHTWDDVTNPVICSTSSINVNFLPEAFPNRIPEDIYDSLALLSMTFWSDIAIFWNSSTNTWSDPGQTRFIFSQYGPPH